MKIAIGSDEAGFELKEVLKMYLVSKGYDVTDHGVYDIRPSMYPEIALKVSEAIKEKQQDRGILVCGTGIGMCMTANKVPGIRAALCSDTFSAERAMKSNDAQIITLGQRVIGPELAKVIVQSWLDAEEVSSSSLSKVECMMNIEKQFLKD